MPALAALRIRGYIALVFQLSGVVLMALPSRSLLALLRPKPMRMVVSIKLFFGSKSAMA